MQRVLFYLKMSVIKQKCTHQCLPGQIRKILGVTSGLMPQSHELSLKAHGFPQWIPASISCENPHVPRPKECNLLGFVSFACMSA